MDWNGVEVRPEVVELSLVCKGKVRHCILLYSQYT